MLLFLRNTIRGVILFLFFILLSSSVLALDSDWQEYAKDSSNLGRQNDSFIGGFPLTGTITYTSVAHGADYQPLAADFDNDGTVEIFVPTTGNTFRLYTYANSALSLEDEHNMGTTLSSQPWSGDIDGDGYIEIVAVYGTTIYTIEYNGTTFDTLTNSTLNNDVETGVTCINDSVYRCYVGTNDTNMTEYNASAGVYRSVNISLGNEFGTDFGDHLSPAVADIDNDGVNEIIVATSPGGGTDEGVMVLNADTLTQDTGFSSDGELTGIGSGSTKINMTGIAAHNMDNAGFTEVCITFTETATNTNDEDGVLRCYSGGDGSQIFGIEAIDDLVTGGKTGMSNPVMVDTDEDGDDEVCVLGSRTSPDVFRLVCYDDEGTLTADTGYLTNDGVVYVTEPATIERRYTISAGLLGTDADTDILFPNAIFGEVGDNYSLAGAINLTTPTSTNIQSNSIIADLDGDNVLEVLGMYSSYFFVASSDFDNDPPTLTDTFGRLWSNPMCNGTTQRYTSEEYDEDAAQPSGTNYYNDVGTDEETLTADCWGNGTLTNGTADTTDPYVECDYNEAGSYVVTIYIWDDQYGYDLTVSDTFGVTVIDSNEPGTICNTGSVAIGASPIDITAPIASTTAVSGGISDTLDIITGGDTDSQILVGFIILLVILAGIASVLQNFMIAVIATAIGVVLITLLGLWPAWILITILIIIVFLGIAIMAMRSGGS